MLARNLDWEEIYDICFREYPEELKKTVIRTPEFSLESNGEDSSEGYHENSNGGDNDNDNDEEGNNEYSNNEDGNNEDDYHDDDNDEDSDDHGGDDGVSEDREGLINL